MSEYATALLALLETPDAFRSWLKAQGSVDAYVGESFNVRECPMARFIAQSEIGLLAAARSHRIIVTTCAMEVISDIIGSIEHVWNPDWMVKFIREIDGDVAQRTRSIMVGEVLQVLEKCCA